MFEKDKSLNVLELSLRISLNERREEERKLQSLSETNMQQVIRSRCNVIDSPIDGPDEPEDIQSEQINHICH